MRTAFCAILLLCLTSPAFADENPIGFKTATLPDVENQRTLQLAVWYPAATTAKPELIADNAVFIGALAVPDAPPAAGEHPLVVLSHG